MDPVQQMIEALAQKQTAPPATFNDRFTYPPEVPVQDPDYERRMMGQIPTPGAMAPTQAQPQAPTPNPYGQAMQGLDPNDFYGALMSLPPR